MSVFGPSYSNIHLPCIYVLGMEPEWGHDPTAHEEWLDLLNQMLFLETLRCHLDSSRYHLVEAMVWADRYCEAINMERHLELLHVWEENISAMIQWIEQEKGRLRAELWRRQPLPRTPFRM